MKTVQILLSTYNGEKYIKEQLDSIIQQDYPDISILIRDDGSTDKTTEILERYAKTYRYITYYVGDNIGAIRSFFDLILHADYSVDYYSFSDQDDYWKPNKISSAIHILNNMGQDKPLLYCGRTTLVDNNLKPLKSSIKTYNMKPGFGNAIVENICTGCTSVINRNLLQLVQNHIPDFCLMHDWWLYLTASCFGDVYYDEESYILYRQHARNVVGIRTSYYKELINRIRKYKGNRGKISRQLKEFYMIYNNTDSNQLILLDDFIDLNDNSLKRIKLLINKNIYRQSKLDDLIYRVLLIKGNL